MLLRREERECLRLVFFDADIFIEEDQEPVVLIPRFQRSGFRRRRKSSDMSEYTVNDTPRVVVPPARMVSKTNMEGALPEGQEVKPKKKGGLKRLLCGFMN